MGFWYTMGVTSFLFKRLIHRSKILNNFFLALARPESLFLSSLLPVSPTSRPTLAGRDVSLVSGCTPGADCSARHAAIGFQKRVHCREVSFDNTNDQFRS